MVCARNPQEILENAKKNDEHQADGVFFWLTGFVAV
jgi:hypothetical protein